MPPRRRRRRAAWLRQGLLTKPLGEAAVAHYAATAALMLDHVHNHSVVLRGLAADTLLVDEDGNLQLVDFRFAKELEAQARAGAHNTHTHARSSLCACVPASPPHLPCIPCRCPKPEHLPPPTLR